MYFQDPHWFVTIHVFHSCWLAHKTCSRVCYRCCMCKCVHFSGLLCGSRGDQSSVCVCVCLWALRRSLCVLLTEQANVRLPLFNQTHLSLSWWDGMPEKASEGFSERHMSNPGADICHLCFGLWDLTSLYSAGSYQYALYLCNLSPLLVMRNACKFLDLVHCHFSRLAALQTLPLIRYFIWPTVSQKSRLSCFALADRLSEHWSCVSGVKKGSYAGQVLLKTGSIGWGSLLRPSLPFTETLSRSFSTFSGAQWTITSHRWIMVKDSGLVLSGLEHEYVLDWSTYR